MSQPSNDTKHFKFSDAELVKFRSIHPCKILELLGWYVKQDRDYCPVNPSSIRFYANLEGRNYEFVVTDNKWFDTREKKGGIGTIDLISYIYQEPFKFASERIKNALEGVVLNDTLFIHKAPNKEPSKSKKTTSLPVKPSIPINKEPITILKHNKKDYYLTIGLELPNWKPKNDMPSMEHPFFTLTSNNTQTLHYENNNVSITIIPSSLGHATIFDKDLWIYFISLLIETKNKNENFQIPRTIYFKMYDFLKSTSRTIDGRSYDAVKKSLTRLRGTTIITDINEETIKASEGFGLIDKWWIVEKSPTNKRMEAIAVTISSFLYNSIKNTQVLTLNPDYFKLRKPLERRIYELARKHCGDQKTWKISLESIYNKSGSSTTLKEFKRQIKKILQNKNIPDYSIKLEENDMLYFFNRHPIIEK